MQDVKKAFPHVQLISENIRETGITSIDAIRKDPLNYLEYEIMVIHEKMRLEVEAAKQDGGVYLFDRSLFDSLFYLIFYTDKADLDKEAMSKLAKLFEQVRYCVLDNPLHRYDAIVLFEPLLNPMGGRNDKFRPSHLDATLDMESFLIKTLTLSYASKKGHGHIISADMSKNNIVELIKPFITHEPTRQ